ncbi:MAG: alanine:cation symporter family protein, partial [Flavobacteriaceae bacterium]|nr:alanine:cation symporter family protein [Flavobacteriaceae bacterium]
MYKKILSLLFTIIPFFTFAQEKGLDQQIDEAFGNATGWFVNLIFYQIPFSDDVRVYWVLFPLILGATYFTFYFKFINFRGFLTSVNIVRGKYDDIDHHESLIAAGDSTPGGDIAETIAIEDHEGEVSHFQALTAALSATVGLGNIAGVAIAVSIGGAGATFWMIIAGFLGMASKFVECTLGVKYRDIAEDGTVYGGPMYYLTKGLKSKGLGGLGKVLAVLFAIFVIGGSFGGGNMFQVN